MKNFKLILISIFILVGTSTQAQKYFFDNYSVKEGLSQSKVYDLIQDKDGFIWLGTASGVSLFDGNTFKNFTADDGLFENGVQKILQDSYGKIWFGHTGGGISVYVDGEFHKIIPDSIEVKGDFVTLTEDYKNRLWIGSQGSGAFRIDNLADIPYKNAVFSHFTGKTKLSDRIFFITETSDSTLYFIIDNQMKYYDEDSATFHTYRHKGVSFFFQMTYMFEDKDHNYWFGTYNGGLLRRDNKSGNVTVFDIRDGLGMNFISCINQDANGDIWVGTWGEGVTRINPNFKIFNQDNGLAGNKIRKIIPDREGNVLIGTNENGLSIFKGEQFVGLFTEHGLLSEQVSAIVEDNRNNIWIGTQEGLCKYNLTGKKIKPFNENGDAMEYEIISLKRASDGTIWVATKKDGIYSFIPGNGGLKYNPRFNSSVLRNGKIVTSMEIDHDDHIWVGTIDGLFYLEPENNAFDRIMGNEISTLYFDENHTMWIGKKGKGVSKIKGLDLENIDTLGNITPLCFSNDANGNTWIGTEGQGIIVLGSDSSVNRFKKEDGLLADLVTALQTDKQGNLWIGTNKGLNQYSPKTDKFYSYTERSGFTGIEVKDNGLYFDGNGNLWCGTVNGLFRYDPSKERINELEPLTHITNLKVNLKDREMVDGLKLNYTEKSVYFEYHSICLTDADKVKFQIMLEGVDNDWLAPTRQTYITYSTLPHGKYTFKVKACNNRGIWNKTPSTYSFIIKPPFYLTWWFIIGTILITVAAIITYINIREKNLRKEKIILENKVKERTAEVTHKNEELAKKNKDITDSITYAQRIQQAILPSEAVIKKYIPESFILFKPKDIVSGDFYWFQVVDDVILFSAIDCTGHGVPGAFMSIMGHEGLQRSIGEFKLKDPADILNKLNNLVQESLQGGDNPNVKDGMDMGLCAYIPEKNLLKFSGANNPLYIIRSADKPNLIRNGEEMKATLTKAGYNLFETKANKQPIGAYISRVPFTCHEFEIISGDTAYVSSDGYADQFGGAKGRKFMYKHMKEVLLENQTTKMEQQKQFYNQIINAWMNNHEQIDDICLMGMRFD
jgi:ligand-binding sensor domain-containing protein/serine phosphatase RsbU (regulator of sigma subunit)